MPILVLDPGHGGKDPGTDGNGLIEKDLALSLSLKVRDWLVQSYVVDVRMTRETDVFVELTERVDMANQWNADYLVSLHLNSGGGEGFESYIYQGTKSTQAGIMQDVLHAEVMAFFEPLGVKDRGKKEADFAVLRQTNMPAILLENLFVDSMFDVNLLKNPDVFTGLAKAIATGIAKAMGLEWGCGWGDLYPVETPDWKKEAVEWLYSQGLLTDSSWRQKIDFPLPLWAEAMILRKLYQKLGGS